jgi:hypothetical protein
MADFTVLTMEANNHTLVAPAWVVVGPTALHEVRWSDSNAQKDVASASWPAMMRPAATAAVPYTYAFTADAVGNGFISELGVDQCPAFTKENYLWARWNWDNLGTFGSAPIFTAYLTTAHAAITRENPSGGLLQGCADTKPGASAFSYLKGNAFGRVGSAGAPAAAPVAAPLVTSGTAGALSPVAGANWIATFQSLQGDNDWILAPFTPAATTADTWYIMFALFTGPGMIPALYTVVMSLKYTWT